MPFTAHLEELRSCLIRSLLAVAAAFLACFAYSEEIFSLLTAPLVQLRTPGLTLIGTAVSEAFFIKIKVAFIGGIFFAFPVILRQSWRFVAPGLYEHEKHYAQKFVFFGTLFFLFGAWFCYEVIFQTGYGFLLRRYQAIGVRPAIKIAEYLSFSSRLLLAFGVTFELPIVAYFLTRIGLIDHRFLIRQFRYAVILILIVAAILTPPDIVSHVLLSLPLLLLYGVSIVVAYLGRQKNI
ncbi:MAG: twin-arginine translocase subunit TatC [Deltaproteobacteria bacterium]|nr:MAG: twin-arginine translocase subunit TatC [Deltaproteobacteria bacterium]